MSGQGKPPFNSRAPEYAAYILLPASKLLKPVPIRVWATKVADGWSGWLETQRRPGTKVLPTFYAKTAWKETTEVGAQKAIAKVTAELEAKAAAEKAATDKSAKRKGSKAAKPGPVKAEPVKTPEPPPEPEPTGTDPGTGTPEASVEATLEQAVTTLGPTETLALVAKVLAKTGPKPVAPVAKPGIRKAAVRAVAPAPTRKRAGGKR